jgi:hypothetical protein
MRLRCLLVCLAAPLLAGASKEELRSSLVTVEGEVLSLGHQAGEGDLDLLTVTLGGGDDGEPVALLLAPKATLDELGFEIGAGDRLKAKVFPAAEGPLKVHKVKNLSHDTLLRLRTLHQIPLWNGIGAWQGGPGQGAMGGPGGHGQHGQRGNGPGR